MLYIIRGLPGSRKSTLAKTLGVFHVEADMYFMENGKYKWEGNRIVNAHNWVRLMVEQALSCGMDVVVSNTLTRKWEVEKLVDLALEYNQPYQVICCRGDYGNVHGVPNETLKKMKDRWEDFEGETIYE